MEKKRLTDGISIEETRLKRGAGRNVGAMDRELHSLFVFNLCFEPLGHFYLFGVVDRPGRLVGHSVDQA